MTKQAAHGSLGSWEFVDYLLPSRNNPVEDWLEDEGAAVEAVFDAMLRYLSTVQVWQLPEYRPLGGGIGEIRFKANRIQYRVVGCAGTTKGRYVLLLGCHHKQNVYQPQNCLKTGKKRAEDYAANPGRIEHRAI